VEVFIWLVVVMMFVLCMVLIGVLRCSVFLGSCVVSCFGNVCMLVVGSVGVLCMNECSMSLMKWCEDFWWFLFSILVRNGLSIIDVSGLLRWWWCSILVSGLLLLVMMV